jgi:hypothetical protein
LTDDEQKDGKNQARRSPEALRRASRVTKQSDCRYQKNAACTPQQQRTPQTCATGLFRL